MWTSETLTSSGCRLLVGLAVVGMLCAASTAHAARKPSQKDRAKARQLAVVAKERAKAKRFDLAAEMFHEAFAMNPTAWAFLFSAARCEQLDGKLTTAKRDYTRYLSYSKGDHGLRVRAQGFLKEVEADVEKKRAAAAAERDEETAKDAAKTANEAAKQADIDAKRSAEAQQRIQSANGSSTLSYALLGGGGLGLGIGAFMLVKASSDKDDLDARLATVGDGGKITGITAAEAQELQDGADLSRTIGAVAIATGAVLAGAAGYLLAGGPASPAASVSWNFAPAPNGAMASLRFAWK